MPTFGALVDEFLAQHNAEASTLASLKKRLRLRAVHAEPHRLELAAGDPAVDRQWAAAQQVRDFLTQPRDRHIRVSETALENIEEALRDAPRRNGRLELSTAEWTILNRLALDARAHAARLRELADSIEQQVRGITHRSCAARAGRCATRATRRRRRIGASRRSVSGVLVISQSYISSSDV